MPASRRSINPLQTLIKRHCPARISGRGGELCVEVGRKDGFQLLQQLDALGWPAAVQTRYHGAGDVRPGRQHAATVLPGELRKGLGQRAIEMRGQRAAQLAGEIIEASMRLTCGKHANEGRRVRLDGSDPVDQASDENAAIAPRLLRIELGGETENPLAKLPDQRGDDVVLAFKELID